VVTQWQYAAVAAYLLWCLFSSLTGVFGCDQDGTAHTTEINGGDKNKETVASR
jgi:hypothetical protein